MRAIRDDHRDVAERLAEDLELLTPAQRARLEGGARLRGILRFGFSFLLVLTAPMAGFVIAILLARLLGLNDAPALAVGLAATVPCVLAGFVAAQRLERRGAAASLERQRRAIVALQQFEASSASSSSSVAVPAMSTMKSK